MKTLPPKDVSRSPRLKEEHSEVPWIRFHLRRDSGKFGLDNKSRGVLSRFWMKEFDWYFMRLGKMLVVDRIRRNSRLNDVLWKILWWHFNLKWVSDKLGLRNQSRGTQSRFLLKTESSAINSQYLDKNTSWVILGRFGVISIRYLVCDAFDTILGRQKPFKDILRHVLLRNVFQAIVGLGT